jgi:molybdopterin-guanine dinucleotide biosynthesis protein A
MAGDDLAAAILVGGQSRRMGENKALIRLQPDGPTVIETVVRKLREVTNEVTLVGSDANPYGFLELPQIPDVTPKIGALGGIHTALSGTTSAHLLIVACDMPFLNVTLLRYMAAQPRDYDALVPVLDRPQPLHAIYARSCLPLIEESIRSGDYRATGWLGAANVHTIDRDTMQRFDPDLRSCFNMNTPADTARARQTIMDMSHRLHRPRT